MQLADIEILLKQEMTSVAVQAVAQPLPGEYNYGRAVGIYAGLFKALQLILDKQAEDEKARNNT